MRNNPMTAFVTLVALTIWMGCEPTGPRTGKLIMTPIADQEIGFADSAKCRYRSASILPVVSGNSGRVFFSMAGKPLGSIFDSVDGVFSWTPTIADFGNNTVIFCAASGGDTAFDTVLLIVKKPVLPSSSIFHFVTPNGGEVYHYGDTILCTWLQNICLARNAMMGVSGNDGKFFCNFFASQLEWPKWPRDQDVSTLKYFRQIDSCTAVGVYKMALIDRNPADCPITFNSSHHKLQLWDDYVAVNVTNARDQTDSVFTVLR